MDEKDKELCDVKLQHLEDRIKWLEEHEDMCKREIFPRLNALEQWKASMVASAMKSAFVIGACSMGGAMLAVVIGHLLKISH